MTKHALKDVIIQHDININKHQFIQQLIQVFLVGCMLGLTRTVLPVMATDEWSLAAQQFLLLTSFVVVFGVVKALMNLFAGRLSERYGRRPF